MIVPGEPQTAQRSSDAWGNLQAVEWNRREGTLSGGTDPRNPVGKAQVVVKAAVRK